MVNRIVIKRPTLKELHREIVSKEAKGWECVKPCFKTEKVNKKFISRNNKEVYDGDEVITRWVVVMEIGEEQLNELRNKGERHSAHYGQGNCGEARGEIH